MKKLSLSVLAILLTSASIMAHTPAHAKKAAKHATCTSCPKGQKCSKSICSDQSCCK